MTAPRPPSTMPASPCGSGAAQAAARLSPTSDLRRPRSEPALAASDVQKSGDSGEEVCSSTRALKLSRRRSAIWLKVWLARPATGCALES